MNGAVFHTSATMIVTCEAKPPALHRMLVPSIAFATPFELKIHFQSSAETTVGDRPRNEDGRAHNAAAPERAVHHQRHRDADDGLQRDGHHREEAAC